MTTDSFSELLAMPGVTEVCELRGPIGFMAYHGGSLEAQTDVIAALAAERSGASYYAVLQPDDVQWHIPSHKVSPTSSRLLQTFVDHVQIVITIHGFGHRDHFTSLLLGGQNRELAHHVAGHLRPLLPDYDVITELERIPKDLRGLHPDNPVNRVRGGGTQLELTPRVRGISPRSQLPGDDGLSPATSSLVQGLVATAHSWKLR